MACVKPRFIHDSFDFEFKNIGPVTCLFAFPNNLTALLDLEVTIRRRRLARVSSRLRVATEGQPASKEPQLHEYH
jgi:hypothetical protein